ncbi:MAG: DegV family protein [Eggerthellales bacterium]|nr:DegV family protein [Eggerthellales bacterium]
MTRIIIDSASDYDRQEAAEKGIKVVPLTYTVDQKGYTDGVDLTSDQFFALLERTGAFSQTSQVSPQAAVDAMVEAREEGKKERGHAPELLCMTLSSALSGTFNSMELAAKMVDSEHIHVVDTRSATAGARILADEALRLANQGMPAAQIVRELENLRSRVRIFASLDTLEYLKRGGRIPATAAAVGDRAQLKPIISVDQKGAVGVLSATLGANRAVANVVKRFKECSFDSSYPVYSVYSYGTENVELLERKLAKEGVIATRRLQIGPVIGTHVGPGAAGVVFVEPKRD